MHRIRFVKPAPSLEPFVRFYSERRVRLRELTVVHPVHARTFPMLEFIFGDPFKVIYGDHRDSRMSPRSVIVGAQTRPNAFLDISGTVDCFVIMFQPDGMHRLFSLPMDELTDMDFDARAVLGPAIGGLEQRLADCASFEERAAVADMFLLRQSARAHALAGVSAAASRILRARGVLRIAPLAADAGLSLRQFERKFVKQVGVRPKLFARIARFEAVLDRKARSLRSWADVAHEFGYFDQMHMIHDFEAFTGQTPTQTLNHLEILFREQIHAIRSGTRPAPLDSELRIMM